MSITDRPGVTGMVCAACGTEVPIGAGALVCPASSPGDRRHVLHFVDSVAPFRPIDHPNPFVAYRAYLAVDAHGAAIGLDDERRLAVIEQLDAAVARVAGTGFRRTPFSREDRLSAALGFAPEGGIWVKDETQNVGGSHKARHLFTEMVQLLMSEAAGTSRWGGGPRPRLAIASCGNAAIAASTLAAAVGWPIDVFVPPSASLTVLTVLESLQASVTVCPRRETDPAGDPCVLRFREAVAAGSVPFGVQGTENAWCRDGGRTLGWEISDEMGHRADRIFVQVGGGAFVADRRLVLLDLRLEHGRRRIEVGADRGGHGVGGIGRVVTCEQPGPGASAEDVVDVTVFLTDIRRDFAAYNRVYAEWFAGPGNPNPTRTTLGITALPTPIAVEVKAIAVVS